MASHSRTAAIVLSAALSGQAMAATYLNGANITVEVGAGTSAGTFNNTFANGATIGKVIDAPSAAAEEFHDQVTHIWFTTGEPGGGLELRFDFQIEYDITTLHFWNYTGEGFDVDNVSFAFFDGSNTSVGSLSLEPALGSSPGIRAQDIALAAPLSEPPPVRRRSRQPRYGASHGGARSSPASSAFTARGIAPCSAASLASARTSPGTS